MSAEGAEGAGGADEGQNDHDGGQDVSDAAEATEAAMDAAEAAAANDPEAAAADEAAAQEAADAYEAALDKDAACMEATREAAREACAEPAVDAWDDPDTLDRAAGGLDCFEDTPAERAAEANAAVAAGDPVETGIEAGIAAETVSISAGTLAALEEVYGPRTVPGPGLLDDVRISPGTLARGVLGPVAAGLSLALSARPVGEEVTAPIGEGLRVSRWSDMAIGEVQRLVDGAWVDTGVIAFSNGAGGYDLDIRDLAAAGIDLPAEAFPDLTPEERALGDLPGFTPAAPAPGIETFPEQGLGLPEHTGTRAPVLDVPGIVVTPIPGPAGPDIVEARKSEPFTTPGGNVITHSGVNETAQEYIEGRKGHTAEQIDDIIANPNPDLSGHQPGTGHLRGETVTVLTGQDGHWVKLNQNGEVFAASNRHLPLNHVENDPDLIERPLEE